MKDSLAISQEVESLFNQLETLLSQNDGDDGQGIAGGQHGDKEIFEDKHLKDTKLWMKISGSRKKFKNRLALFSNLCEKIHAQNDALLSEQNLVSFHDNDPAKDDGSNPDSPDSNIPLQSQQTHLSPKGEDNLFHEALIRDREMAIQSLQDAVIDIHDIFLDISGLVQEQQYSIGIYSDTL